jgi:hypothetical protein
MRVVAVMLAFVSVGGMSLATADPSTGQSSAPAASAPAPMQRSASDSSTTAVQAPATNNGNPAPTPGQSATPTSTAAAAPAVDQEEKHLVSEGYRIQMRNGEKYFCRREEELGSRLGGQIACGTEQQLEATEAQAKRMTQQAQSQQSTGPSSK